MTIDNIQIRTLRVVVAVAERGTFAAAGRHLDLPRAAISRIVGQLEDRVGMRLFRRNTRKVVPTETGEQLVIAARQALRALDAALGGMDGSAGPLSGVVRLSVSHAFGRHFVLPALGRFRILHPSVQVETQLEDRLDDMVEADIDLSVRLGPIPDSDLVIRRLGTLRSGLFAAPSLHLDQPIASNALEHLPAIGFRVPGTGRFLPWPVLEADGGMRTIVPRPVMSSGSIEAVADLARDGHGIALLPQYLAANDVAAQRLEPILPDSVGMETDVHICFRERQFMPKRVRAVIDHLVEDIAEALRAV